MNLSRYTNKDMDAIVIKKDESLLTTTIRLSENTSDMIFNCASLCEKFMVNEWDNQLKFFFVDGSMATVQEHQWKNAYRSKLLEMFKYKEVK